MDLVNEKDVARAEVCEDGRKVAYALNCGAGSHPHLCVHLFGDKVRKRRLAETRRPVEKKVLWRMFPLFGRKKQYPEVLFCVFLPDILVPPRRTKRLVKVSLLALLRHRRNSRIFSGFSAHVCRTHLKTYRSQKLRKIRGKNGEDEGGVPRYSDRG